VPLYAVGEHQGQLYFSMKLIEGGSLAGHLPRFRHDPHGVARLVQTVARAVHHAHQRGILHRDLKPANILLDGDGQPYVTDLGLCKRVEADHKQTRTGQLVGTPAYVAPEQAAGRLDQLGPATDTYSLGATLYHLLTGQSPFPHPGQEGVGKLLRKVEKGEFPPPRQVKAHVPRPLEAVCLKAMAARPEDRYATVEALGRDVQQWLAGEPVSAWPEPWIVRAGRWVRRNRVLATSTATALLVLLLLGTAGGVYWQEQRRWARDQAVLALERSEELRLRYRFEDAQAMMEQAEKWATRAHDGDLQARLARARRELDLASDLDNVRHQAVTVTDEGKWGVDRMLEDYPRVLAKHGFDVLRGDLEELAQQIGASPMREGLVAALDEWARAEGWESPNWPRLLRLANLTDKSADLPPDSWRQDVRLALLQKDPERVRQCLLDRREGKPTPAIVLLLASAFSTESAEPTDLLRRMQRERPDDFWISFS
jgi:serine/threonine-protein kinase